MKTSLLDSKILEFLKVDLGKDERTQGAEYFLDDFTLNWEKIKNDFFQEIRYQEVLINQDECLKLKYKFEPILKESLKVHLNKTRFTGQIRESCGWTHRTEDVVRQFEASSDQTNVQVLEDVLFLTSLLENSLGNLYWTLTTKTPPHLLKDLLDIQEIKDFFGVDEIFFLQLILGTSKGANVRNVVWHGFPSYHEISPCYSSILFVIVVSFGRIISNFLIKPRFRINYISIFSQINFEFEFPAKCSKIQKMLESPDKSIIPKSHHKHWMKILGYHKSGDYFSGILLLFPELELLLRCIYGQLNQVSINACADQYYIIMDTVFHEYIVEGTDSPFKLDRSYNEAGIINRIHQKFPPDLMHLFHDVFESPDGPRIRDKMSHGEVRIEDLNQSIFDKLLGIAEIVLSHYSNGAESLFQYDSKFHINCQFSIKYNEFLITLNELPTTLQIPNELTNEVDWSDIDSKFNEFACWDLEPLKEKVNISFRNGMENELVKTQLKIMNNLKMAVENLQTSYSERFKVFEAKQLRSSRRKTLTQMMKNLPHILQGFTLIMKVVAKIFAKLQANNKVENSVRLAKYLRFTQKYIENMVQYLNINQNQWIQSKLTTSGFLNYVVLHRRLIEEL